jgi:hypothetical protein
MENRGEQLSIDDVKYQSMVRYHTRFADPAPSLVCAKPLTPFTSDNRTPIMTISGLLYSSIYFPHIFLIHSGQERLP